MNNELNYAITYIPLNKLSVVWTKAQRPFNEKWAAQIGQNFDPDKFEPLIVTKPNGAGIYHIVEGQHRKAAAEIALGLTQQVPCHVIDHADPARAADIWLGVNKGRKAVRPVVAFMIAVEAKWPVEVAINNIVRKSGYHITESGSQDNAIASVAILKRIYEKFGGNILTYTLEMTRLLWGSDPRGAGGSMLNGVSIFLNEFHTHVDAKRLRSAIQAKYSSPWKLVDAANQFKEKASEHVGVALAEVIRMTYNKSLKQNEQHKRLVRKEI